MSVQTRQCDPRRIADFLDGRLSQPDQAVLEEHLSECVTCRASLGAQTADDELWDKASRYLRDEEEELESPPGAGDSAAECDQSYSIQHVLAALGPTDDPAMLGRLGGYEISGVVGSGGMGVVLKALDKSLDRTVAIKVMAPHLATSGAARKRFAREAKAAAAVLHPNVMAIHSVSNGESLPFLVMPYMRGTSLQKRLDAEGPLPVGQILRIASQTAAGLAAAHAQGLVHRDIKPANIMLEEGVERVALTDFGLARAVDDGTMTRTGLIAGTPQFMSPEQARGESIDQRSDLFSLGSVLYAMCTGRPPFRAETSYGILRRITDTEPRPIREINPDVPEWLCQIVAKLMAKRSVDRFNSADELAKLLEDCLAHVQQPTTVPLPKALAQSVGDNTVPSKRKGVLLMVGAICCALTVWIVAQVTSPQGDNGRAEQIGTVLGKPVLESELNKNVELHEDLFRLFVRPVEVKHLQELKLDPEERVRQRIPNDAIRNGALMFVRQRVLHEALYKERGGRVLLTAFGPFAYDAHRKWLQEREKAGDFTLSRPEHRALLFAELDETLRVRLTEDPDTIRQAFDPAATEKFIQQMSGIPAGAVHDPRLKLVGVVLGKPIYVQDVHLRDREVLPELLYRMIVPGLEDHYREQHPEVIPTEEEISVLAARLKKNDESTLALYRQSLAKIESQLKQATPGSPEYKSLQAQVQVSQSKIRRTDARKSAEFLAGPKKLQQHLFDRYGGGRVLQTPQGPVAFDAQREWVLKRQTLGDFQITDPSLNKALYDYWDARPKRTPAGYLIEDAEEVRAAFGNGSSGEDQGASVATPAPHALAKKDSTAARSTSAAKDMRDPAGRRVAELIAVVKENTEIAEAMTELGRITGLDFSVRETRGTRAAWLEWWQREQSCIDNAQDGVRPFTVKGNVTDQNGDPIPGITVRVTVPFKASPTGVYQLAYTITDRNGKYVLSLGLPSFASKNLGSLPARFSVLPLPTYSLSSEDGSVTKQLPVGLSRGQDDEPDSRDWLHPNQPATIGFMLRAKQ